MHGRAAHGPGSRLVLVGGVGPALIFQRDDGAAVAGRSNLFSGDIGDSYTPHLGAPSVRQPGARLRRDFVLLAGMSWRAD